MTELKIDLSERSGAIKPMNCVNNGPIDGGVRNSYNNFDTYKAACIPFARNHDASFCASYGGEHIVDVHRIFRNFDADETNPENYIFEPTDKYIATTLAAGTQIFYRLGASIEHGYKFGTRVPKDFAKWARICEHIIRHYNEGWANGFHHNIEYWEIWNEPDLGIFDGASPCWQGNAEQFNELYCVTSKHLKEQFPNLKIGGCAFYNPKENPLKTMVLDSVAKGKAHMDFFSFHWYGRFAAELAPYIRKNRETLDLLGLSHIPMVLDEYNYIKGFSGENWKDSLKAEKNLKGSAFISSIMCMGQHEPLDMLMYYDARPCAMNGLFKNETFECLKGYYTFMMYSELVKLGTHIPTDYMKEDIYSCAATDGDNSAVMLSYYNDADEAEARTVKLEFEGGNMPLRVRVYVLDEEKNLEPVREEIFSADKFSVVIDMQINSSVLVKLERM